MFQSPLGEVVKETFFTTKYKYVCTSVSIPSRGSGKGDITRFFWLYLRKEVSIPSRGSGKGD